MRASASAVRRLEAGWPARRERSGGEGPDEQLDGGPHQRQVGRHVEQELEVSLLGPSLEGEVERRGHALEAAERILRRLRNGEQRIEFRKFEERLEVLVQPGEPELPALLANLLRQGHEHPKTRRIDIAGAA